MGYWGTLVAVRSNGRMPAMLSARGAEERVHPGALRGGGWQVFDVADDLLEDPEFVRTLAAEAGSPVLAAYIADSDDGWLVGISHSGRWAARLNPFGIGLGLPAWRAADAAVGWAADAGFRVAARPIRQIITTWRVPGLSALSLLPWKRYVFAEDMFFDLLDQIGIPRHDPADRSEFRDPSEL